VSEHDIPEDLELEMQWRASVIESVDKALEAMWHVRYDLTHAWAYDEHPEWVELMEQAWGATRQLWLEVGGQPGDSDFE
jgi:hypothetical protein